MLSTWFVTPLNPLGVYMVGCLSQSSYVKYLSWCWSQKTAWKQVKIYSCCQNLRCLLGSLRQPLTRGPTACLCCCVSRVLEGAHPACLQHFHAVENEMDVHLMSWRAVALLQHFVGRRRLASLGSCSSVTDPQLFASDDALVLAPVLGNTHLFDYSGALWLSVWPSLKC